VTARLGARNRVQGLQRVERHGFSTVKEES
jgi:hypothetical protein